nr:hypothetical protein BaRGS_026684 [Batillaria attramentaria]
MPDLRDGTCTGGVGEGQPDLVLLQGIEDRRPWNRVDDSCEDDFLSSAEVKVKVKVMASILREQPSRSP